MVDTKKGRIVIKLKNLRDMWNCFGLYMVILLALLYLSCIALEGLSISGKVLKEIIRIEIRSQRTVSIITSLCGQCCEGVKVSEVDNIKRKIANAI